MSLPGRRARAGSPATTCATCAFTAGTIGPPTPSLARISTPGNGNSAKPLGNGSFGENLTTCGYDINDALIGERWRIGSGLVVEVTGGRIPCRTFADWLGEKGWVRRFTQAARTGAFLRVVEPGQVRPGDRIDVVRRPGHDVTVSLLFRAATVERDLLPLTLPAVDWMESGFRETVLAYLQKVK